MLQVKSINRIIFAVATYQSSESTACAAVWGKQLSCAEIYDVHASSWKQLSIQIYVQIYMVFLSHEYLPKGKDKIRRSIIRLTEKTTFWAYLYTFFICFSGALFNICHYSMFEFLTAQKTLTCNVQTCPNILVDGNWKNFNPE